MSQIIEIFTNLFTIIQSVISFVFKLIQDLVDIVSMLGEFIIRAPEYIGFFFPSIITTLFLTCLSVAVIYKIAGREG